MADAKITMQLTIEPVATEEGEKLPQGIVFSTHRYSVEAAFPFMEAELELMLDYFYKGVKRAWNTGASEKFKKEWMSE